MTKMQQEWKWLGLVDQKIKINMALCEEKQNKYVKQEEITGDERTLYT